MASCLVAFGRFCGVLHAGVRLRPAHTFRIAQCIDRAWLNPVSGGVVGNSALQIRRRQAKSALLVPELNVTLNGIPYPQLRRVEPSPAQVSLDPTLFKSCSGAVLLDVLVRIRRRVSSRQRRSRCFCLRFRGASANAWKRIVCGVVWVPGCVWSWQEPSTVDWKAGGADPPGMPEFLEHTAIHLFRATAVGEKWYAPMSHA